ncbi:MarR family transcriptional regulator [Enterococcus pseudoavium]|uniref:MarR family transcriptional regulator n=1 Tax=Enterococcus pseudoavium TaxID=44007 RepID=A0AAE4L3J3_9ENTE|nr:MarR family transcriptional regulator [Enterococcus pseudoavium]MDT2736819.1 MarR family transcriptional regulator [Enterococcus pseudoavium]MDT2754751.1 MarR family transcriptional regulator [Enterococcus pseudoavium]MDT2770430.1 MarR family transcriptional regulator [Enterococcus pseudoavium]
MENTGYLIMNSSKKLTYQLNTALREGELTAPQWAVIQQIRRFERTNQTITANQLTKLLEMDKPTISAMIKRLEQKKFISRIQSPLDSRAYYLRLTVQGKQAYEFGKAISDEVLSSFLAPLSEAEQQRLNQLLEQLDQE